MTINGIWTGDVYGPFGWESHGVFILENGRLLGGDHRQCSSGSYRVSGQQVTAAFTVHYYGSPRVMFGAAQKQHSIELDGTREGNEINGTIRLPDKPAFDLQIRLSRLMEIPADVEVGEALAGVAVRQDPSGPHIGANKARVMEACEQV